MKNDIVKFKIILLSSASALFLAGCVQNVDLRQQAKEEKAQEHKSIVSMQCKVDLKEEKAEVAQAPEIGANKPIKILFVGDMMFDRHIREAVGKYGGGDYNYILEPLKAKLSEYDLVVGNLEGPITDNESVSVNTEIGEGKNFVFTFDPAMAVVLAGNNIRLVNLGNNHILNQGAKGIEQTKKYLDEAGVDYFSSDGFLEIGFPIGNPISKKEVSFVSYNYSVADSEGKAIEEIKSAKEKTGIVVVCPHWGAEYKVGDPGETIRALAHRFVDAGADAVIGTHPHVVQNSEEYNGKKIYYSLGNFIFDQYFQKETMEGLGVEMAINPEGGLEYGELDFEMTKRGQTKIK